MTSSRLVLRGLSHYWRTNLAVVAGVAVAVTVLAGALIVGDSVRGSLRDLVLQRLGRADLVIVSSDFFRTQLADDLRADESFRQDFVGRRTDGRGARGGDGPGVRAASVARAGLRRGRAVLALPRRGGHPAAHVARGAAQSGACTRPRRVGRRHDPGPGSTAVGDPAGIAARAEGGSRPDAAVERPRGARARQSRRVLHPAAAGRGARRVRPARAPPAGSRGRRACKRPAGVRDRCHGCAGRRTARAVSVSKPPSDAGLRWKISG